MKKYQGYTDGSGNNTGDKSGGWAFVLDFSGFRVESSGYEKIQPTTVWRLWEL